MMLYQADIIERLRAIAAMDLRTGPILAHILDTANEAADEIDRLRVVEASLIKIGLGTEKRLEAEIEQLRRWVLATSRSLEQSGLTIEEYNAITAKVLR